MSVSPVFRVSPSGRRAPVVRDLFHPMKSNGQSDDSVAQDGEQSLETSSDRIMKNQVYSSILNFSAGDVSNWRNCHLRFLGIEVLNSRILLIYNQLRYVLRKYSFCLEDIV